MTSVRTVFTYLAAFMVMGFLYWILNEIIIMFRPHSETGTVFTLTNYLWDGLLLIFMVFGTFWLIRKLKEWEVVR